MNSKMRSIAMCALAAGVAGLGLSISGAVAPLAAGPGATKADMQIVANCLKAAGDNYGRATACIGQASAACQEDPNQQSTLGMSDCFRREDAVWDKRLNTAYGKLGGLFSAQSVRKLRDMQRAWIKWRDAKCEMPYLIYEGGTMAQPMAASCRMEATALRSLELEQAVTQLEGPG